MPRRAQFFSNVEPVGRGDGVFRRTRTSSARNWYGTCEGRLAIGGTGRISARLGDHRLREFSCGSPVEALRFQVLAIRSPSHRVRNRVAPLRSRWHLLVRPAVTGSWASPSSPSVRVFPPDDALLGERSDLGVA